MTRTRVTGHFAFGAFLRIFVALPRFLRLVRSVGRTRIGIFPRSPNAPGLRVSEHAFLFRFESMESHALTDQFFKSWVLSFLIAAAVVGALEAMDLLAIDRVLTRQAPVWAALMLLCSIGPVLRYFGVLKAEVEQRWGDYTIASVLGRSTGALIGSAFAWAFAVLGG
ncbi:hypothetical protein AWB78_02886 [Caballeronia calidae]|uniref:Uncharacterized protein n=2 Tax=Caballeronia calidae TaxID=1777139 RepID=A0A158BN01_9BURK|nr:hypothetical protein AWB78_02886 [Caballeronia calidae]